MPEADLPAREIPPMITVRTAAQAEAAERRGFRVVRYPEDWREEALTRLLEEMNPGEWLRLPDVCEEATLEMIRGLTERFREKLGGVVLGTAGQLGVRWPVPYGAGSGIPVMNRQAAALLMEEGCEFVTASPELTGRELAELTAGGAPVAVNVYGRVQVMLLHHCPARTALGLKKGHRECRMCDQNHPDALAAENVLEDRMGHRFPMLRERMPEGCLVRLMNMLPTDLGDKGVPGPVAIEMTTESGEATREIVDRILNGERGPEEATRGHWKRPVL